LRRRRRSFRSGRGVEDDSGAHGTAVQAFSAEDDTGFVHGVVEGHHGLDLGGGRGFAGLGERVRFEEEDEAHV
jgi:hypothetical protein